MGKSKASNRAKAPQERSARAKRRASEAASRKRAQENAAARHEASRQPGASTSPDDLLDEAEAALVVKASPHTLSVWRSTKRYPLPYVKIGRLVRYRRGDIESFIAARTVAPGQ